MQAGSEVDSFSGLSPVLLDTGKALGLKQRVVATAVVFFKRFYLGYVGSNGPCGLMFMPDALLGRVQEPICGGEPMAAVCHRIVRVQQSGRIAREG